MKLSDVSIKNPVFAWMLMLSLITFGAICFSRMGISQLPDVDFPVLNISVTLDGAAPEVMEQTVAEPLEDILMTVEGIKSISSSSKSGLANISLEFELEKNIDVALQEVQTKVAQAQRVLPKDIQSPIITKTNPDDQPIIWLALTSKKHDLKYMNSYAKNYVRDRFTTVEGVGDVFLGGYTDPAIRVWVDPKKLQQHNITVNDVIDTIQTEHNELPGGQVIEGLKSFNVRTMGEAKSVEELSNIAIYRRAGQMVADPTQVVKLREVAQVEDGLDEIRRTSRFNGDIAIGLGVRKQRGSNAVAVAKAVKAKVVEIQKDLPEGMSVVVNSDSTRFIEQSIGELNKHLVLAVLLTSLVCWIFLGSWSATFNVLLSIPTSIVGAFIGLYFMGFTLNTFTLLGLTLAIGIVVDDAIMVLENIFRYRELKYGKVESAILGAREIAFAAMAATAAVIAIFLPVAFLKGAIGKYFLQFGVTISFAVFLSLLESLTITPMRSSQFVNVGERTTRLGRAFDLMMEKLRDGYKSGLDRIILHPWKTIFISTGLVIASFLLVKLIPKEFAPLQDQSFFLVRLQLPIGSTLEYTDKQSRQVEEWLRAQPEVKQIFASVGGFSGSASDTNTAVMFVTMVDKNKRDLSQQEFMAKARPEINKVNDVKGTLQDLSSRSFAGGRGFGVEFVIKGPNWEKLSTMSRAMMDEMEKSGLMVDVDSNYLMGMPEVQIKPDRGQTAMHGVSIASVGQTVNALIGGVKVGQFPKDGQRLDIRVQAKTDKNQMEELPHLMIGNSRANLIPLSRLVKIEKGQSLQQISRIDRQRAITIYANLKPGVVQSQAMAFIQKIAPSILNEPGYTMDNKGSSKAMAETFGGLGIALVLGILIAYMVLASQFNSFIDPVSILLSMPFSVGGAFLALLITRQSLNMYSLIGILLLMGIVKKNSIMLVEFANVVRNRGQTDVIKALLEACPIRLRPILMTSFATIASAIPSALATGDGSETVKPMAITIIGGVFVSTILTLYVVPCAYLLLDKLSHRDRAQKQIKEAFENANKVDESMMHT